jgi:triacylglycerol lipase
MISDNNSMSKTIPYTHRGRTAVKRPILREAFWGVDWLALRASWVYYGLGVPRGDGSAVVLIPGFLSNDYYLTELYLWLRRIGYKPFMSKIGVNADCLDKLGHRLIETVERAQKKTGKPVHLIGHSLGGILARSVAAQRAESVRSVIALGSPFRGIRSHPMVIRASDQVRARILRENRNEHPACYTGYCNCEAVKAWEAPFPQQVSQTAVYTKTDGIVDWRVCVDNNAANNYEVKGTHVGLVVNSQVYRIIADRLSQSNARSA